MVRWSVTRQPEGRHSASESITERQLAPPEGVRQIKPGTGILVYRDLPPIPLELRPWYEDWTLVDKVDPDFARQEFEYYAEHSHGAQRRRARRRLRQFNKRQAAAAGPAASGTGRPHDHHRRERLATPTTSTAHHPRRLPATPREPAGRSAPLPSISPASGRPVITPPPRCSGRARRLRTWRRRRQRRPAAAAVGGDVPRGRSLVQRRADAGRHGQRRTVAAPGRPAAQRPGH